MASTVTTTANAIRQKYEPGVVEAVFYNDALMGLTSNGRRVFPVLDSGGDTAHRWHVHSAASSSTETYVEGQVQPLAGSQTYTRPALGYTWVRHLVQITGHARAAVRGGWFDVLDREMQLGIRQIQDVFSNTFLNGTNGLQEAIDSTTTYAGITRGSASYFESAETAVSGVLTHASMYDLHETLRDAERAANTSEMLWIMPENQISNYAALDNALGSATRRELGLAGGGFDRGFKSDGMGSMGRPIIGMPDLTSTVILLLDTSPGNFNLVQHQGLQVKEMAPIADSDVFQLSMALGLPCKKPLTQGKLTAVTA